jgi:hypothetical protein
MEQSPFSKLPAEMRNKIWDLCVTCKAPLQIQDLSNCDQRAITRTCHQIRAETLLMFYGGNNTFELRVDSGDVDRDGNRRSPSGVHIDADGHFNKGFTAALKCLSSHGGELKARGARLDIIVLCHPRWFYRDLEGRQSDYRKLVQKAAECGYDKDKVFFGGVHQGIFRSEHERESFESKDDQYQEPSEEDVCKFMLAKCLGMEEVGWRGVF